MTNEGEAVPASPPSASLTQLTPFPSLLKKRGAMRKLFYSIVPLSNSFREGEIKGVSYKKRKDNVKKHLYILLPLSNSFREGE